MKRFVTIAFLTIVLSCFSVSVFAGEKAGEGNWDFNLKGIYRGKNKNVDETTFFFHWEYSF